MPDVKYRDVTTAAEEIGLSKETMIALLEEGHLPGIKLGETWLVSMERILDFLRREEDRQLRGKAASVHAPRPTRLRRSAMTRKTGVFEYSLLGKRQTARSVIDVLTDVLTELAQRDPEFLQRFSQEGGRSRRYVATAPERLYPGRPDLAERFSRELKAGWWMGTNYSSREIVKILKRACEVAGLNWGSDVYFSQRADGANRAKALGFVGVAQDSATDVARRHDAYFAESLSNAGS